MFKSEVKGKSMVVFGGKVGITIGKFRVVKQPHVSVGFEESENIGIVGKYYKVDKKDNTIPPVKLIFTKIESIDTVINMLNQAKEKLKMEIDTSDYDEFENIEDLDEL